MVDQRIKTRCQYGDCKHGAEIGYYCWKHNPYDKMYDPKEQKKLDNHYKNKETLELVLLHIAFYLLMMAAVYWVYVR